ncbi:MAG: ASKHA domain-containing protein [Candidatus Muiribacteriota bacterium]
MLLIDAGTTNIKSISKNKNKFEYFFSKNPQTEYGSDLIARVEFGLKGKKCFEKLRLALINEIKNHIKYHYKNKNELLIIIGNTVIEHFYSGKNIKGFSKYPYRMEKKLNKNNEFLEGISSFAGSDTLPLILEMKKEKKDNMLGVDFGTNCEIILKNKNKFFLTTTPAGSAFEMSVEKEKSYIKEIDFNGSFRLKKSGPGDVYSIYPAGLIKLLNILLDIELLSRGGPLKRDIQIEKLNINNNLIRDFLKAKAAVSTALSMLVNKYSSDKVKILKAAGNMINSESLDYMKNIGIIPNCESVYCDKLLENFYKYIEKRLKDNKLDKIIAELKENVFYVPHYMMPEYDKNYINNLNFGVLKWKKNFLEPTV